MLLVNFNSDKDNSLCVIRNIDRVSFFSPLLPASCLKYNKSFRLIYCNSIVTIDLVGSFIFNSPLLIFTSLNGANFTLLGFSKEL
ncbi:hypothetical protein HMPREF9447_03626 [Bacteroides oleiciplenus YIT 12058]|uniref:Uncharacterized protein n=1 Tax=Bacteroides oleiciplenus YIT 12058 TaxID=742727 RepID=K9E101_9BACE|nr:hypothetical protein HMPREF9447_03626 [Bacteroides oleiciplenus YIT 12058]